MAFTLGERNERNEHDEPHWTGLEGTWRGHDAMVLWDMFHQGDASITIIASFVSLFAKVFSTFLASHSKQDAGALG